MLNIILFGPPGAGKGTQSTHIVQNYNLIHISTGDLFRKHLEKKTDIGLHAKHYLDEGNLVPDEVVSQMVKEQINDQWNRVGFIFDGYPRTLSQAVSLDQVLKQHQQEITVMIALELEEKELIARVKGRAKVEGRQDDQSEEKINNRIRVYHQETLPVMMHYSDRKKLHKINGQGTIDEIFSKIKKTIVSYQS